MPKAAAQPIAGAPRTVIERMASATSAALVQRTYSRRAGSCRWSISSRLSPRQRSVSTAPDSDDTLVAAIHRHLSTSGLCEQRPAHLGDKLGDVPAADFGAEHVVGLVLLDRHAVLPGTLCQHVFRPQGGIK